MEMGKKILAIDADDPEALVGVAQVIVEKTHDTDLDKDQKLADAKKNAERALVTVDTDVPTSGLSARPDRRLQEWSTVRGVCHPGHAVVQCQELGGSGDESAEVH